MSPNEATKKAVVIAGGNMKVAEALDCKPKTITSWIRTQVPLEKVKSLCELSGNYIQPYQIRPDFFEKQ